MNTRGVVAATVLGAWGAGIAVFARREMRRSPLEHLAEGAMRVVPGVTWLAAERDGRQLGFVSITVDTLPREVQVTEYFVADAPGTGDSVRRSAQTIVRLSRGLALRSFERSIAVGPDTSRLTGSVESDSVIAYAVHGGGERDSGTVHHGGSPFLMPLVPIVAALHQRPKVGRALDIEVFDVESRTTKTLALNVVAESMFVVPDSAALDRTTGRWIPARRDSVRGWRLVSRSQATLDEWIDELGRVLESRIGGFVFRRTAFEIAFENWRLGSPAAGFGAHAGGEIVSSTLLAAGGSAGAETLDTLRVRIHRMSSSAFALGQDFRSGNLLVTSRIPSGALVAEYTLPTDERFRRGRAFLLRREPRIEVDDPAIMALAMRLSGNESNPLKVIGSILAWVQDSIAKDPSAPPGSAAQVLSNRRGDCNEHARLFVALSRAAGIPARGAAGLLYAGGKFYYHAWAEVAVGRRLLPIDPMLGQLPADAAHLRWMSGSLDLQTELMRLMGGLELEVVGTVGFSGHRAASRGVRP